MVGRTLHTTTSFHRCRLFRTLGICGIAKLSRSGKIEWLVNHRRSKEDEREDSTGIFLRRARHWSPASLSLGDRLPDGLFFLRGI